MKSIDYKPILEYFGEQDALIYLANKSDLWTGTWPPPNEPICGYLGSRCLGKDALWIWKNYLNIIFVQMKRFVFGTRLSEQS